MFVYVSMWRLHKNNNPDTNSKAYVTESLLGRSERRKCPLIIKMLKPL